MVLRDSLVKGYVDGVAYTRNYGSRSQNPTKREFFHRRNIVIAFAGPVAEHMVNEGLLHLDYDVQTIASSLLELLPTKKQFLTGGYEDFGGDLWMLVYILATCTRRERALEEIAMDEMMKELDEDPCQKIDPAIFEMLWPLAQQAHAIIHLHWFSVKRLAWDLLKTRSLGREEIEARLPWAGQLVVK